MSLLAIFTADCPYYNRIDSKRELKLKEIYRSVVDKRTRFYVNIKKNLERRCKSTLKL